MTRTVQQLFNLEGKTALVTGASGYLAEAFLAAFANAPAALVLLGVVAFVLYLNRFQIGPEERALDRLFGEEGVRWFHTGGIFAALASNTAEAVIEAVEVARKYGTIVSYDLNYRPSLWKSIGGKERAQEVNRRIAKSVDVMIGNEEDFTACLGFHVEGAVPAPSPLRCAVVPHSIVERRHAARGVSWVGLASRCHDVKGHVPLQALERESNPRHSDLLSDALPI